jgi:hypothetical protein
MRMDLHRQRAWLVASALVAAAALAFYLAMAWQSPTRLSGGSTVGLWYGLSGGGLMIAVGLLALHRRLMRYWGLLGPRRVWLKFHIWFGLVSVVFALCHSGFSLGGTLEQWLWASVAVVVVSGLWGVAAQHFLPRLMLERLPAEAPYDEIPHLALQLQAACDELAERLLAEGEASAAGRGDAARQRFHEFYEKEVRPFLAPSARMGHGERGVLSRRESAEAAFASLLATPELSPWREALLKIRDYCEERRQLREQERLQFWLHNWLAVHIPAAIVMYVLMGFHAVVTMLY